MSVNSFGFGERRAGGGDYRGRAEAVARTDGGRSVLIIRLDQKSESYIEKMCATIQANFRKAGLSGDIENVSSPKILAALTARLGVGRRDCSGVRYERVIIAGHSCYFRDDKDTRAVPEENRSIGGFGLDRVSDLVAFLVAQKLARHVDFYCCEVGLDALIWESKHGERTIPYEHRFVENELIVNLSDLEAVVDGKRFSKSTLQCVAESVHSRVRDRAFTLRGFCGAGLIRDDDELKMVSLERDVVRMVRPVDKRGLPLIGKEVPAHLFERALRAAVGIHGIQAVQIEVDREESEGYSAYGRGWEESKSESKDGDEPVDERSRAAAVASRPRRTGGGGGGSAVDEGTPTGGAPPSGKGKKKPGKGPRRT